MSPAGQLALTSAILFCGSPSAISQDALPAPNFSSSFLTLSSSDDCIFAAVSSDQLFSLTVRHLNLVPSGNDDCNTCCSVNLEWSESSRAIKTLLGRPCGLPSAARTMRV